MSSVLRKAIGRSLAAGVAALLLVACQPKPVCPQGFAPDEARTARVLEVLRADAEGRSLVEREGLRGACYSAVGEGQVSPGPVLLLSATEPVPAVAARAAHLLLHERDGMVSGVESGRCAAADLADYRAAEERAWALEARIRARHGLAERPSEVEGLMKEYEARCAGLAKSRAGR
ncbi:MAG: hypothetical protein QM765_04935 [Myxococcales bacterium]